MRVAVFCQTHEFCFACYETGGEYGLPVKYHCNDEVCRYPDKNCLFRQNGASMLNISIFYSPEEFNTFAASRVGPDGMSTFYVVKWVVFHNPVTRKTEYHVMHTVDPKDKAGMHMRKGVKQ